MPGNAELLLDTSAAVALLVADHPSHPDVRERLSGRTLGLAGHAAFETYSVLTRLPAPVRRSPETVSRLIAANFPQTRFLPADAHRQLLARLARDGIAGGAVYDALVGFVAVHSGVALGTRDERARATYVRLGVTLLELR